MASEFLYFRYPKNSVEINNNFAPNDYLLNPYVDYYDTHNYEYRRDYYYYINWFRAIDYDFRSLSNTTGYDFYTNISFAHINQESHCNINKTFVTCASQYIKQDNREYIIHIVFYYNQIKIKKEDNDYSILIIKDNFSDLLNYETLTERFSDNKSYVVSTSDSTEYSLSEMDF